MPNHFPWRFRLALALCSASLAGHSCLASAAAASDYFPLQDGASWTYQVDGVAGYTRTVVPGTTLINGVATKAIQYSEGSALYVTSDSNGVKQYRSVTPQETDTFDPPVVLASGTAAVGQNVSSSGTLTAVNPLLGPGPVTLGYSASSGISSPEFVTVPAGRFVTVLITTSINASGTVNGNQASVSISISSWLAKGVGVVKQIQTVGTPTGTTTTTALLTGTTLSIPAPLVPASSRLPVAAGSAHSLAMKQDGSVWAWGTNAYGQLGDGSTASRSTPVQVSGLSGIVAIAAGSGHSLALKSDGTVWAWGSNASGELGDGSVTNRSTPVQAIGLSSVTAIAAGGGHSLALTADGAVRAWGRGNFGQLGNGAIVNSSLPVQVSGLGNVVSVAAGYNHSLALKSDGTVWSWGSNQVYQLGKNSNSVYSSYEAAPIQVYNIGAAVAISAGIFHSLALNADGSVFAWGDNGLGQLGVPVTTLANSPPIPVEGMSVNIAAAAAHFNLAVGEDGTVWSWGSNYSGELGRTSSGYAYVLPQPGQIPGLSGITAVAAGTELSSSNLPGHSLAVHSDGSVWAWGANDAGQIGNGTHVSTSVPVQVAGPDGIGFLNLKSFSAWSLVPGWNLLGNGLTGTFDVASVFSDAAKATTVWKWIANGAKWAFYAPSLAGQALTDYAISKGYDVLTAINGGEGFWVNAKAAFTAQLPTGTAVTSSSFQSLASGWSLNAVGDNPTPSTFNKTLSATPPAAGDIPVNLTTLWAWDAALTNWYFYAPSLEKNGGLAAYITSKNYLDFGTKVLDPATGFWVNKP